MTSIELLQKTKRTLQKYGWIKGREGNKKDGFCMVGALCYQKNIKSSVWNTTLLALRAETGQAPVLLFNDAKTTKLGDVMAAIDRAITVLKRRHHR